MKPHGFHFIGRNFANTVKFFDDSSKLLFELSAIKTSPLILDKSNFLHAGWFKFELYEDGQLKEKNKLFIPKEF